MDESLTSFIEEVTGESHLRVEDDFGDGFVRLRSAEAERRQAKHDIRCTEDIIIEMLRNSRDAHARNIFVAISREDTIRRIVMIDDGDGVPPAMQERIFEPRVTSKLDSIHVDDWGVHGRGMALYSISSNAENAFIVQSDKDKGAAFVIESNLHKLSEKTDQSTHPLFYRNERGALVIRGPKNINRTIAEFAFQCRETCTVFCGSPTDIAATLFAYGEATVSKQVRTFCPDVDTLPLTKRLCVAADPESLAHAAAQLGLCISERSARRILDGQIQALPSVVETIRIHDDESGDLARKPSPTTTSTQKDISKDVRGLKIHGDDIADFSERIKDAYRDLAEAYYLESGVTPEIRVTSEGIHIKIPVSKQQ